MKIKNTLVLVAAIALSGNTLAAQDWTLQKIVESAINNHPSVQSSRSAQSAALAEREAAEWQRYPTFSADVSRQDNGSDAQLYRVEQPIWNAGRIAAAVDAAEGRVGSADKLILETQRELALSAVAAAVEAARQQARQKVAEKGVASLTELLNMIQRRVDQTISPEADLKLAEARMLTAENDVVAAKQGLHNALIELSQLTGSNVAAVAGITDTAQAYEKRLPASLHEAHSVAMDTSPTLARIAYEMAAANADIDSQRSVFYPQLALRLEHEEGSVSDSRALLALSMQPGAGLSASANVKAAIARRQAIQFERDSSVRTLKQALSNDWNNRELAHTRLRNAIEALQRANEVAESYSRQYAVGKKNWLDVLNAVRESIQSGLQVEDIRAQLQTAELRLAVQLGEQISDLNND